MNGAIEIRPLRSGDAESLVACFRRCYGGTYVAEALNDATKAEAAIQAGRLRSIVGVDPVEGVVAHMGLTPRGGGALVAELGMTVVDPRYRGQDVTVRLTTVLARSCRELGLVGFIHYPTTAHPAMQKLAEQGGGVELGVLLDYIPAGTRYSGFEGSEPAARVAVVAVYHALSEAPARRMWVPSRHSGLARSVYSRLGFEREVCESRAALPAAPSRFEASFEERRGLLKVAVEAIGADLAERIEARASTHPAAPTIVDLPLGEPAVGAAVDQLAGAGFFFGAILPEYVPDGDVLRLQRVLGEPVAPVLAAFRSEELFLYATRDRSRTGIVAGS